MKKIKNKVEIDTLINKEFVDHFSALVKSRQPIIYISSLEEKRVIDFLKIFCQNGGYHGFTWDCFSGLYDLNSNEIINLDDPSSPILILDRIIEKLNNVDSYNKADIYVLLDYYRFLKPCDPEIERRLKYISHHSKNDIIVIVSPYYQSTPSLDKDMRLIDFPPPNSKEIEEIIDQITDAVSEKIPEIKLETNENKLDIINSVKGLTYNEINSALTKSVCMHRTMHIPTILKEKQEVIRKTGILEFFNTEIDINEVGGLENLIEFLKLRKQCFFEDARNFGIDPPKGILLCGPPGTGKSLVAKATMSLYKIPLLRLDFGALFGSYVGDSERNIRQVIKIAESMAPVILWLDEVEKGVSTGKNSSSTDGGVTSRVISTLLTWMQEKKETVFMMCTANDHTGIPAEFMRAGRFDEIFFVDLPNTSDRKSIIKKILERKKQNHLNEHHINKIAHMSDGYTGAELEKAINNSLITAYYDNKRLITELDIVSSVQSFKPLSIVKSEYVNNLRKWAKENCVFASKEIEQSQRINVSNLEIN